MDKLKIRGIYEYEFHRGTSSAETARRINDVYGAGSANERTVRFWFQRFRSGNFDLHNEPRGWPDTQVNNEELKAIVEADPSQTTSKLASAFGVSDKTIIIHLRQIGKVKNSKSGYRTNWLKQTNKHASLAAFLCLIVTIMREFWIVSWLVIRNGSCTIIGSDHHNGLTLENRQNLSLSENWPKRRFCLCLVD